ncbi:IclR family transcriptional regulator [Paenarthrobacter sp. NPDC058040]|uniref:IclR family transcriptional regulator n=1 Tax=unclassified Paenarthrobacter TaxID=2634190 RepID=UPI0036DF47F7
MAQAKNEAFPHGTTPLGDPGATNKSVIKAMSLLREVGRHRQGINVTELAQAVAVTRPTAFRLLLSLEHSGFVDRVDNRYLLGWQVGRLGKLADPYAAVVSRIQPILDDYAAQMRETLGFSVPQGDLAYETIAEATGTRYLSATHFQIVGRGYPLHASASGKILLAEQPDERLFQTVPEVLERFTDSSITSRAALIAEVRKARETGFAVLDNELEDGLFAVACAVRDPDKKLVGILSVNGPTQRLRSRSVHETAAQLFTAARAIYQAINTPSKGTP